MYSSQTHFGFTNKGSEKLRFQDIALYFCKIDLGHPVNITFEGFICGDKCNSVECICGNSTNHPHYNNHQYCCIPKDKPCIQGDPNQNPFFQMALPLKNYAFLTLC